MFFYLLVELVNREAKYFKRFIFFANCEDNNNNVFFVVVVTNTKCIKP